jgi:hypothetical protein
MPRLPRIVGKRYLADIPLLRFPCHLRRHEVFAGAAALFFMQP